MPEDRRLWAITDLLLEHLKSPSVRHIRDPYAVSKLAQAILKKVDGPLSPWQKWSGLREAMLRPAANCWLPIEDLRGSLNQLPGPPLTATDVSERLKAIQEEDRVYPSDELKSLCLDMYAREKEEGTELMAIITAMHEFVEVEEERLRVEREERYRQRLKEERILLQQRLLSGADCSWTNVDGSEEVYCRVNGRTYRLSPTKDKMWELCRIAAIQDPKGALVGKYKYRRDATKAVRQVAYSDEPFFPGRN